MRNVAGICLLLAGLVIGSAGGAVAGAETGAESTSSQGADSAGSAERSTSGPVRDAVTALRSTVRSTVDDLSSTVESLAKAGQERAAAAATLPGIPSATAVARGGVDGYSSAAAGTGSDARPGARGETRSDSSEAALALRDVALESSDPVADLSGVAPAASAKPADDPLTPYAQAVEPIRNAVKTVAAVVESVPAAVATLPTSETPVTDVITLMQGMLTSVHDAVVPLTHVPSDLYELFDFPAAGPVVDGVQTGNASATGVNIALPEPSRAPLLPQVVGVADLEGAPVVGQVTVPLMPENVALGGSSPDPLVSAMPPRSQADAGTTSLQTAHVVAAILVPVSLAALVALALPGVGGLLMFYATGVRIGYRHAKARMELRAAGVARFARRGPLGVVRSGSLVAVRPQNVRPETSTAARRLTQVA